MYNDEQKQELILKASFFEKQAQEIEQQLSLINHEIREFHLLKENLSSLNFSKEKEMLASIGKGIFLEAKSLSSKDFFVDVGSNVIVKKTLEETHTLIKAQIEKFEHAQVELLQKLEVYRHLLHELMQEARSIEHDHPHEHTHNANVHKNHQHSHSK